MSAQMENLKNKIESAFDLLDELHSELSYDHYSQLHFAISEISASHLAIDNVTPVSVSEKDHFKTIHAFASTMLENSEPMPAEFEGIFQECFEELLAKDEPDQNTGSGLLRSNLQTESEKP